MKAVGYIRCSTQEQADSGLGLDAQAERINAYCGMRDLELLHLVSDPAVSGGKPLSQRPGGQQLLSMMKRKQAQAVVMLKLDRMFRNAADCLSTVEKWDKAEIALHVIDLGGNAIDTTSAAGRFMLVVLAGAAEMERNLVSERTRAALARKRASGRRAGTVPYGFDLASEGDLLVPNEREQQAIAQIIAMRRKGLTYMAIANHLTAHGVPTKQGRSMAWGHSSIASILNRAPVD